MLNQELQTLEQDELITMFTLVTPTDTFRFCPTESVTFDSNQYLAFPISAEGFQYDGKGMASEPTLTLALTDGITELLDLSEDLVGYEVIRTRTFRKFLGTTLKLPDDRYYIEQKTTHTSSIVQFKLSNKASQEGRRIPARQIIKDTCNAIYRTYKNGQFSYEKATCPYTGTECFKKDGTPTTASSEDRCGKRVTDCELRFGVSTDGLPFFGFPGVSRIGG